MNDFKSKKVLKVALIGGGINSAVGLCHMSALRLDGLYEVVCGCFSTDSQLNLSSAQQYGISLDRNYENLDSLLLSEHNNIDAVIVATPIQLHFEQIKLILSYGLPVICESH